jgi:hypothetical protein
VRRPAHPTRSVRFVVGWPAGGVADIFARLIGQWLSERLGQPMVIDPLRDCLAIHAQAAIGSQHIQLGAGRRGCPYADLDRSLRIDQAFLHCNAEHAAMKQMGRFDQIGAGIEMDQRQRTMFFGVGFERRMTDLGVDVPPRDQQTPEALGAFEKLVADLGANIKAEQSSRDTVRYSVAPAKARPLG